MWIHRCMGRVAIPFLLYLESTSRNLYPQLSDHTGMAKHLVLVAGNIGAGKTALTERIGSRLGWWTGFESVADNPYLPDFYADMRSWSFHLQIFFLGHRSEQY